MYPTQAPERAKEMYPNSKLILVTAPEGVPEEECGNVEALVGQVEGGIFDGGPSMRTYWTLEEEDLEQLKAGAVIELAFFTNGMPIHGMKVV